jgi:hypothetical protein
LESSGGGNSFTDFNLSQPKVRSTTQGFSNIVKPFFSKGRSRMALRKALRYAG